MFLSSAVQVQSEERRGRHDGARHLGRAHQAHRRVQGRHVLREARGCGEITLYFPPLEYFGATQSS